METPTRERSVRPTYEVYDRISVPEDVPELGVEKGDEGVIRELVFHDSVAAFVEVPYSTGQTRGWVVVEIMPEKRVLSYSSENGARPGAPLT